ncbi:MAG TPA: amphi-Trp domain-containing protein [Terriglobales bacterium]|nr:amphi-Trp domain-containing protein [Terriglobales bacterium]
MAIAKKKARDVERSASRPQFIAKLGRLAEALAAGKSFVLQVAGERIRIPRNATISVEHERAGGSEELEFQLKWERPGDPPPRASKRRAKM